MHRAGGVIATSCGQRQFGRGEIEPGQGSKPGRGKFDMGIWTVD